MSYDVSIGDQSFNYTYNLSAFFRDHMPEGINGLSGLTGKQAAASLSAAFVQIHTTYGRTGKAHICAKYDAPNGWGSVVGALIFLGRLMAACQANPRKRVHVC